MLLYYLEFTVYVFHQSAATVISSLALHDALPISLVPRRARVLDAGCGSGRHGGYLAEAGHQVVGVDGDPELIDRKSTRLNSSHVSISYAVFCLKNKRARILILLWI